MQEIDWNSWKNVVKQIKIYLNQSKKILRIIENWEKICEK